MGLKEEFLKQWEDVYRSVESAVIKQLNQNRAVSIDVLNRAVERETSAWNNVFEKKGRFIEKVRNINPEKADSILRQITDFRLSPVNTPSLHSASALAAGAVAGAGTFSALQFIAHTSVWISAAVGVAGLAAATALFGERSKESNRAAVKASCEEYLRQVDKKGEDLVSILEGLD